MTLVHVPARLRVGAPIAVGLLVAASVINSPVTNAAPANLAGMVVFLDPGHNGANDASISRQVPTGRGGTLGGRHPAHVAVAVDDGPGAPGLLALHEEPFAALVREEA